ncbi:hypothetical protein JCM3774_002070 [Rhodotorula dairenensis]
MEGRRIKPEKKRKRRRSPSPSPPPSSSGPSYSQRDLETLKAAVQQVDREAYAAVQPLVEQILARRKRAWRAGWTGRIAGVAVSSADLDDLHKSTKDRGMTNHEEKYARVLREARDQDYAETRARLAHSVCLHLKRAALEIFRSRLYGTPWLSSTVAQ